ncbi:MAG TPA: aspartate 1-decarboxylase [Candidatus Omnitrophota bacterium]|nr:aspartate 1-decarboxylase [Candidatus Omnitrophota bacterium]HPS20821.1 aspartate 1-decarboxylase [Candidatus Omnitrophota bacterium]
MLRTFYRSKINKAVVTGKELHYNGSIGIDSAIIKAADILPGEQVHVLNVDSGDRFVTYVIEERSGSGKIVLYGPAARCGEIGDEIVIITYCSATEEEYKKAKKRKVSLKNNNKIK